MGALRSSSVLGAGTELMLHSPYTNVWHLPARDTGREVGCGGSVADSPAAMGLYPSCGSQEMLLLFF